MTRHSDNNLPPIRRIVAMLARQAAREWVASCTNGRAPSVTVTGTDERPAHHDKS
jgi:hypothetical protein